MLDRTDGAQLMRALKKVSETLLKQLAQDIAVIDADLVASGLQQRQHLITALAQMPTEERRAFQETHTELVNQTQDIGQACIEAIHRQGLALSETQRQMSHGRHLLQTYEPEAEQQSHFIEDDA